MGFFSKIGKGIKSAFKSIGRGIKSAFKRFGKFMNKIGVLGQVAMMFILPGVGNMLASAWSGIAGQTAGQAAAAAAGQAAATGAAATGATTTAATSIGANAAADVAKTIAAGSVKGASAQAIAAKTLAIGSSKATGLMAKEGFAKGVGKLMQFTGKVVGTPGRVFSNITQGVTETLGNFAKTASNNIFGSSFTTAAGDTLSGKFFSGGDSAFGRSFGSTSKFANVLAKSPTIATKQAVDNFTPGKGVLKPEFQSSLTEADMYKLPDTPTLRPNDAFDNLEVGMKPGGELDLSRPVKDFDAAKFSGDGGKSLIADQYPNSQAALKARVNPYDNPKFDLNPNDPTLLADASGNLNAVTAESPFPLKPSPEGGVPVVESTADYVRKPRSLLGQATDRVQEGLSSGFERARTEAGEYLDDPIGKARELMFGGFEKSIKQGIQYKAKEALGLTPDMPDQYVTYSRAYVPTFDTGGGAGSYQAPETMNARAFEQNVLSAPNQYGYTAFQYDQYMNRTAQA